MPNVTAASWTFSGPAQQDGRRYVAETFTLASGTSTVAVRLSEAGEDNDATLSAKRAAMEDALQASEIAANVAQVLAVGSLASPTFVFSTANQNLAALRAAYADATQLQAVMIGDFLSSLTNGQLQAIFGMTAGQVTTLRTNRLTPAANAAAAIRAAAGQ